MGKYRFIEHSSCYIVKKYNNGTFSLSDKQKTNPFGLCRREKMSNFNEHFR
jgi:hypothetical protein